MMFRNVVVKTSSGNLRGGSRGWGWFEKAAKNLDQLKSPLAELAYDGALAQVQNDLNIEKQQRLKYFLDVKLAKNKDTERLVLELANDIVPKTTENFVNLTDKYRNSTIHNITKNTFISGGDFTAGNGTGGESSLSDGGFLEDENFALQFSQSGVIGMANCGKNRNKSQFFITLRPMTHLNGRNVAFGRVIEGMDVLKKIDNVFTAKGKPITDVVIEDCGVLAN